MSSYKDAVLLSVSGNPGVGTVTIAGNVTHYLNMAAGDDGQLFDITIYDCDTNGNLSGNIEVQKSSLYTHAAGTFTRSSGNVVASTTGNLINFSSGTQRVAISPVTSLAITQALVPATISSLGQVQVGNGIQVNNGVISVTGNTGGTVTSVQVSGGTTGLIFTGGPITTAGTLTLSGVVNPSSLPATVVYTPQLYPYQPNYNAILQGGCAADGVTDDTTALMTSATTAQAAGLPLYMPSGTYKVSVAGSTPLLNFTTNSSKVFGDGIGKTVVLNSPNLALTASQSNMVVSTARDFQINGITFNGGGDTMSGAVVTAAVVVSGGVGYTNGDTITLNYTGGGNFGNISTVLTVTNSSAGVIQAAGVSVTNGGSWSWANIAVGGGTQNSTSGGGSGATFTLTFGTLRQQCGILLSGAFQDIVNGNELVNFYGANTAGGSAIAFSSTWNSYEYTPNLGTSVTAGSLASVTPSAITGCYASRRVDVDTSVAGGKQTAIAAQPQTVGTAYVVGDVLTTTGGSGTQATFYVGALRAITVTLVGGGSGYANGDTIQVVGGTLSVGPLGLPTVLRVTNQVGGVIQTGGLALTGTGSQAGSYSTTPGAGTLTTTAVTGTGSGATCTLTYSMDQIGCQTAAAITSIAAAGTGYRTNDLIPLSGGTFGIPTILIVVSVNGSGGITSARIIEGGTYSATPSNAVSAATGITPAGGLVSAGSGATFNMTWQFFNGRSATCGKFSTAPTNPVTISGGSGSSGTINVYFGPEPVLILWDGPNNFVSYFQVDHLSTAPCGLWAFGNSYHTISNNYIHDCYYCTGIGGQGNGTKIVGNRITNVGAYNNTQHGLYLQGGEYYIAGNYFEGCGAASMQIQATDPNLEASGTKIIGNTSVDPGQFHLVLNANAGPTQINSAGNFQANPQVALGGVLNRHAEVVGNTWRCTGTRVYAPSTAFSIQVPIEFIGNTLEDVCGAVSDIQGSNVWISLQPGADGTRIVSNHLRMNLAINCQNMIAASAALNDVKISNNFFDNIGGGVLFSISNGLRWSIKDNDFTLAPSYNSTMIALTGSNHDLSGNEVSTVNGSIGATAHFFSLSATATFADIHDNKVLFPSTSWVCQLTAGTGSARVYNNDWSTGGGFRLSGSAPSLTSPIEYWNNAGQVNNGGVVGTILSKSSGLLQQVATSATVAIGKIAKYDGSGSITPCLTSDVQSAVAGVTLSPNATSTWVMIASQIGSVVPAIVEAAAGVSAGDICILSTTTAATIHSTGNQVTIPTAGFVCRALTTTAANGTATIKILDLGGGCSVTSVGVSMPSIFNVSGSPITTSGTISVTMASQVSGTALMGPVSGASVPTFRQITSTDLPIASNSVFGIVQVGSGIQVNSGVISVSGGGGSSSGVTSVALTVPSFLSVAGSPITTSGTLAVSLQNEVSGTAFMGPVSGSASTPTFRALQATDVPSLPYVTSVALAVPAEFSVGGSPITSGGTITVSKATEASGTAWMGPVSGSAAAPTFRAIQGTDLPLATSSAFGAIQVGSGIQVNSGVISVSGGGGSGSGTVTSVALTVPAFLSVAGSPVTTSGTLAVSLATEASGTAFMGPVSGSAAAPTFRNLQYADLSSLIPAGVIWQYGASGSPNGWLNCDGTSYSKTTYAALYGVIGVTYGGTVSGTTFNVPDLRGRVAVGPDPTGVHMPVNTPAIGTSLGEEQHTLSTPEIPSHTHPPPNNHAYFMATNNGAAGCLYGVNPGSSGPGDIFDEFSTPSLGATGPQGGGGPHNNVQPSLAINYIIKM